MSIIYPNGAGDTLGDTLVTCRPLYSSGNVWYVLNTIGVDAATPAGQNREKPLATLGQALTNAVNNDIIVLLTGHTETLTGQLDIGKSVTIVGAGRAGNLPTVKLLNSQENGTLLVADAPNVELRNIWFPPNTSLNPSPRVDVEATSFRMIGCYIECGQTDTGAAVSFGTTSGLARIVNTTIISVATSRAAQPLSAISLAAATSDLELDGLVLSGGTVGFSNYQAFDGSGFAISRLRGLSVSLLLGADVALNASTTGYLNIQTSTGGSRVRW